MSRKIPRTPCVLRQLARERWQQSHHAALPNSRDDISVEFATFSRNTLSVRFYPAVHASVRMMVLDKLRDRRRGDYVATTADVLRSPSDDAPQPRQNRHRAPFPRDDVSLGLWDGGRPIRGTTRVGRISRVYR